MAIGGINILLWLVGFFLPTPISTAGQLIGMDVGLVRPAQSSDFDRLAELATQDASANGWETVAKKSHCLVMTRRNDVSSFKMLRMTSTMSNVSAATVYNCLQDADYRPVWDKNVVESREICVLDSENDIGYYQVRTPPPLRNRDFVTQRSWRQNGHIYMIMNHSVFHKAEPPRKNIIRGISYYTGYFIESTGSNSCRLTYISQSDPGGSLPSWLVNKLLTVVAPKIAQRLMRACEKYESWKKKHRPEYMPWLHPEQITASIINWDDIETSQSVDSLEDSQHEDVITPNDMSDTMIADDDDLSA